MTARARRPYHHGNLRRALLDATLELAAERSPAGVSLREAARQAGVSQAAPYRHFRDKEEMLAAASEEGFRLTLEAIRAARLGALGPREQIIAWTELYVRFAIEHPAHFRLMYGQGSPPKSSTTGLQAAARETFQSFFAAVQLLAAPWRLERAKQHALALEIWSFAHGLANLALDGQTVFLGVPIERAPEIARRSAETFLDGVARRHVR